MDKTAIEAIAAMAPPYRETIDAFEYSDKPLYSVNSPSALALKTTTLKGLCELIEGEAEAVNGMTIVIESYEEVKVYGLLRWDRSRELLYKAVADTPEWIFDRKIGIEAMIINLKSRFIETEQSNKLVTILSGMSAENKEEINDNGFAQTVVTTTGIATKSNVVIEPKQKLQPFRTFIELEQPESEFLIRFFKDFTVALYEADGGAWKIKAKELIAEYLKTELKDTIAENDIIIVK